MQQNGLFGSVNNLFKNFMHEETSRLKCQEIEGFKRVILGKKIYIITKKAVFKTSYMRNPKYTNTLLL